MTALPFYMHRAFTVIELLIVVVVVSILATLTIVAYNGITGQSQVASLKSDLNSAARQLHAYRIDSNGEYPGDTSMLAKTSTVSFSEYIHDAPGATFCISAVDTRLPGKTFHITQSSAVEDGSCPLPPPVNIQSVTKAACPEVRTVVTDSRDNKTYFIQKIADGNCWMLTNLSYSGGGENTHGDVRPLVNGTGDATLSYVEPRFYVHASANPTAFPAEPSTHSAGGGNAVTGARQYGYLYNWCAAMGAQYLTGACSVSPLPGPDKNASICPAGWRLPNGNIATEDFGKLNETINNNSSAHTGVYQSHLLMQYSGRWYSGSFGFQGSRAFFWSATHNGTSAALAIDVTSSQVGSSSSTKTYGYAVRCIAV